MEAAKKIKLWFEEKNIVIIFTILFFLIWEIAVFVFKLPSYILPSPIHILIELKNNISILMQFTFVTAYESFLGVFLAAIIGVPLALLITFSDFLKKTVYPLVVSIQLVPKIALAPLFVTWFGYGLAPKIIIVFLLCFFPIILNSLLGFMSINKEYETFIKSTGAGPITAFFKIRFPFALPYIFLGFRWAAVNATVGATIGEWIGGDAGLGYYMQIATGDLRMNLAFAIIIMLAILGLILLEAVKYLEKKVIPWHSSQRNKEEKRLV